MLMTRTSIARASLVALVIAAAPPLGLRAQPPTDDPQTLQKRIAALEAGQQAILKELQAIKALLMAKPATPPLAASAALPMTPVSIGESAIRGDEKAKLTIVEFSDFECPFCGRFTRETYAQIQREYVDTGKVRYVFRHLPLEGVHPQAFGAAVAGECAGAQGKFWEMHDRMFANQRALTHAGLLQTAQGLGLDVAAFEKCLGSEPPKKKVRQDLADAAALNANATPSFFFGVEEKGGKVKVLQRLTGAKTFSIFKTTLDTILSSPALKD
jgi:protein-disulfide isomerase